MSDSSLPAAVFGAQLKETRKAKGWSQERLAKELEHLGGGMHATAIAKIEAGTRKVTLEEALQISEALDVGPVHLIVPRDDDQRMRLANGGQNYEPPVLRDWVRGVLPLYWHPGVGDPASNKFFYSQRPASEIARSHDEAMAAQEERLDALSQQIEDLNVQQEAVKAWINSLNREVMEQQQRDQIGD